MQSSSKNSTLMWFLVVVVIIIVAAGYTFYNAKGMSYFSDDSAACNNCHVMNDVYASWRTSAHSREINGKPIASCNDCHLPNEFVDKWIAKAQSGISHAYAFTFKLDDLPQNFTATKMSKNMVQANCVRCHSQMVSVVVNPTTKINHANEQLSCVKCHASVGHTRGF